MSVILPAIKKVKLTIRFIVEYIVTCLDVFIPANKTRSTDKTLLIVRPDGIGDYILFRNFLYSIKKSKKYKDYQLTLLACKPVIQIAKGLDSGVIDNFLEIDPEAIWYKVFYRRKILKDLNSKNYDTVFYPVYSRLFTFDAIIKKLSGTKIAVNGDTTNIPFLLKWIGNTYYSHLIEIDSKIKFEFDKNKAIIPSFIDAPVDIAKPEIIIPESNASGEHTVVVFPDARFEYRRWPEDRYAKLCKFIISKYKYKIVITGNNKKASEAIVAINEGDYVTDMTSKTSLMELITIISKAKLLVSNDTGVVHIGAALNKKVICISKGNYYGRFAPYPNNITDKVIVITPPTMANISPDVSYNQFGYEHTIESITLEEVIQATEKVLS